MLANEIPQAHYADSALILCTVLSSCASICWPGRGFDGRRFVELLVKQSSPNLRASWISVPALLNKGLVSEEQTAYRGGNATRIFTDDEIDMSYHDAQRKFPNTSQEDLRKSCYASLIYEWLRCGYAHEYWHNQNITHVAPSRKDARLSYIGRSQIGKNNIRRMISFHLSYLVNLAGYHVQHLPESELKKPSTWWIDKG